MHVAQIVADPSSSKFAVMRSDESDRRVYVFEASGPQPIFMDAAAFRSLGMTFVKCDGDSQLVMLDSAFRISTWATVKAATRNLTPKISGAAKSLFATIYGESLNSSKPENLVVSLGTTIDRTISAEGRMLSFLEAPSHIVAAPSRLITSFMKEILIARSGADVSSTEQVADDELEAQPSVEKIADVSDPISLGSLDNWMDALIISKGLLGPTEASEMPVRN